MPYVGMFTEDKIQKAIDRAGERLGDGESGLVAHLDYKDEVSIAVIKKFGSVVSVEAIAVLDISEGWKFDKDKLSIEANLIVKW
jgi:hypothetical protein